VASGPILPYPGWGEDTVRFPARYFEEGRLPGVCVVTGAPATCNLRRHFSSTPGWVGCLFFVSLLAFLIALVATHRSATGQLPVCSAVDERIRRLHRYVVRLTTMAVVAWIAIIPAAITLSEARLAVAVCMTLLTIGLLAIIGAGMADLRESATLGIQGRVVRDGFGDRWIQLRGVHPAFARAVATRLGR
jgi:hypothetical protein